MNVNQFFVELSAIRITNGLGLRRPHCLAQKILDAPLTPKAFANFQSRVGVCDNPGTI
jgi:hypothetical protein